jgi:branched-chain amino acid transport system substrate-binding protein
LRKTHPWRTIAYIGPDIAFGHSAYEELRYNLNRFNVAHTVVATYWPALYTRDYDRFITSLLRDAPDILATDLYGNDFRKFIRQGNRRGLFTRCRPCAVIGGGHYDNFRDLRDEMPLGMIVSGMNLINWPATDRHKRFVERVRHMTGEFPSTGFTNTYNSILLLAQVVRTTGKPQDTPALVKALEGMKIELPSNPDGSPAYVDPLTHQLVQPIAIGEVVENKDYPPATRQGGHWKVYMPADLLAPVDYVKERRKGARMSVRQDPLMTTE